MKNIRTNKKPRLVALVFLMGGSIPLLALEGTEAVTAARAVYGGNENFEGGKIIGHYDGRDLNDELFTLRGMAVDYQQKNTGPFVVRIEGGKGKGSVMADERITFGNYPSILLNFTDRERETSILTWKRTPILEPNRIYEVRAMVRARNIKLTQNFFYLEFRDGSKKKNFGTRLITWENAGAFHMARIYIHSFPDAGKSEAIKFRAKGRPVSDGLVLGPSQIWISSITIIDHGKTLELTPETMIDDFDGPGIRRWWYNVNPMDWSAKYRDFEKLRAAIVEDGERKCIRLQGTWGQLMRPFRESITNVDVTFDFKEVGRKPSQKTGRLLVLCNKDWQQLGLGSFWASTSHFCHFYRGEFGPTSIMLDAEWHTGTFSVRPGGTTIYLDGVEVARKKEFTSFLRVELGETQWHGGEYYFDNFKITKAE